MSLSSIITTLRDLLPLTFAQVLRARSLQQSA